MNELLDALNAGNTKAINPLACQLFIHGDGTCNWKAIKEFETFANCNIVPLEEDGEGWLLGGIKFKGKTYIFLNY